MDVRFHPHAYERLRERSATEDEVIATVISGERFAARYGRTCFRKYFSCREPWRGRRYATKQVEAYAVEEDGWFVITVIVKFIGESPL